MVFRHKEYRPEDDIRETPADLFARLDATRHFTIDACALPQNAKCPLFYSPTGLWLKDAEGFAELQLDGVTGLSGLYTGQDVFCNPPFSQFDLWLPWAWANSDANSIAMIAPGVRGDRPWWQKWVEPYRDGKASKTAVRALGAPADWQLSTTFLEGRIDFLEDGHPIWMRDDQGEVLRYKRSGKTHNAGDPKVSTAMFGLVILDWTHA